MNEAAAIPAKPTNVISDRAYLGWHLRAFAEDLTEGVTAVDIGRHRLVAVRNDEEVRVFDATCPHRGAHLGHGGRLEDGHLLCPFHGRAVRLGGEADGASAYQVAEHQSLMADDALFIRLAGGPDNGFAAALAGLTQSHTIRAGFRVELPVEGSIVIENAFDPEHFDTVHDVSRVPDMDPYVGPAGELDVDSTLNTPGRVSWEGEGPVASAYGFWARAYSPSLVLTRVGPDERSPFFFTGTTPSADGCVARVAVAIPNRDDGREHSPLYVAGLVAGSIEAFQQDTPVWANLAKDFVPRFDARDRAVRAFRAFVEGFTR